MTVKSEAAGNRTDTLNSSICSKSTRNAILRKRKRKRKIRNRVLKNAKKKINKQKTIFQISRATEIITFCLHDNYKRNSSIVDFFFAQQMLSDKILRVQERERGSEINNQIGISASRITERKQNALPSFSHRHHIIDTRITHPPRTYQTETNIYINDKS